jgi:hypothetical protein
MNLPTPIVDGGTRRNRAQAGGASFVTSVTSAQSRCGSAGTPHKDFHQQLCTQGRIGAVSSTHAAARRRYEPIQLAPSRCATKALCAPGRVGTQARIANSALPVRRNVGDGPRCDQVAPLDVVTLEFPFGIVSSPKNPADFTDFGEDRPVTSFGRAHVSFSSFRGSSALRSKSRAASR